MPARNYPCRARPTLTDRVNILSGMRHFSERFTVGFAGQRTDTRRHLNIAHILFIDQLPIYVEILLLIANGIARQSDDTFNVILILMRWDENHDFSALWVVDIQNFCANDR